jgi:aminobenzoyl-glutamate transport protein
MSKENTGFISKFLNIIEKVGNLLPHPATLFAIFAGLTIILSWVFSLTDLSVVHPATKETVTPFSLLSAKGIQMILTKMVDNFTGFAPLGTVLVSLLGIGIAEGSGLIAATIRGIVQNSHKILIGLLISIILVASIVSMDLYIIIGSVIIGILLVFLIIWLNNKKPEIILTFIIVFSGILSNTASEVGYVLLVPLGAIMFLGAGRHPFAGMAAAFAGVSGGYSANLLLGTIDPLLAGLSQEAARIIDQTYTVSPAANYYFMAASTFFIGITGTWVTQKFVEPRLGAYTGEINLSKEDEDKVKELSKLEKRGILFAVLALIIFLSFVLIGVIPEWGYLREIGVADDALFIKKIQPALKSIVAFIFIGAGLMGIGYGIGAKTFKSDSDVMNGMGKSMETLGIYIVLVFFASQFVAYFNWTNLGLIFAINGADFLSTAGFDSIPLLISFIILAAIINLVMGSASAKWAIMAPVFIPMFMLIGFSPELTQGAYRVGDSVTNIISPMMSYFALIIAFLQRYEKNAGIGTLIATMVPYTFFFFFVWTIFFLIWFVFEIPLGPDSPMFYSMPELP